jgi:fatty acid desaturase
MSAGWWRSSHNKHHAMPQKLGHDVDLNTMPLVAFTEKVCKGIGVPAKMWIRIQAVMFPTATTLVAWLLYQFYLHPQHILHVKNWREIFWISLRYASWTAFFTAKFGLSQSALMYLGFTWVTANYLFLHFALSHTHLPTVPEEDTQVRISPTSTNPTKS